MIGVIARPLDHDVVREFFELFKTPWEFRRAGRSYDVVLCHDDADDGAVNARVVIVYVRTAGTGDDEDAVPLGAPGMATMLSYRGHRIPIQGRSVTYETNDGAVREEASGRAVVSVTRSTDRVVVRVGYDLFREVRIALTEGQSPEHADIPTVDMHIALLRELILDALPPAVPLVEIPPAPAGHPFIACLTHDIDHPSIRRHRADHTMLGFLYRAIVGSLVDAWRGRVSLRTVLSNWAAATKLPFVHVGLARDFWADFVRYPDVEAGLPSTFYVIPFAGIAGEMRRGPAPARRAARYGARDIATSLHTLRAAGCEIGVHGIDAWHDSVRGRQELEAVAAAAETTELGVRMHWLYGDGDSPATLEKAGFAYDATSGYNETVGYRAGTTQVFKPLEAVHLLELPLHVMDTALFYPRHLHLSVPEALARVRQVIDHARRLGGTVTINWHDRSLAPERLWGTAYREVLAELRSQRPWFATAAGAVGWFRKRRSAVFECIRTEPRLLRASVAATADGDVPGLRLRVHMPRGGRPRGLEAPARYIDVPLHSGSEAVVAL